MVERERILLVDDRPENLAMLASLLGNHYIRQVATSGPVALELANREPKPDLILLDVNMPEMDGYEVCRRLRAEEKTREIPVIFVTARDATEDETRGFAEGAVDYITKPFSPPVVLARVRTHLALRRASREMARQNDLLRQERELVERIVLRVRQADRCDWTGLRMLLSAVEQTTGDLVLSLSRKDGVQHVLVGDFTGHGLPAAIMGPIVAHIFQRQTEMGADMTVILEEINRELHRRLPTGLYMAAGFLALDRREGRVRLWNRGLPAILRFHQGRCLQQRPSSGLPLGILDETSAREDEQLWQVTAGERLVLSSDGVTEIPVDAEGNLLGTDGLIRLMEELMRRNDPLESLLEQLRALREVFQDDVTLVELTV
ncbi:MAG: SpoIIE family protein phosphatase [Magnetococcales bacterium]|nr:SpoIIE family protein phosphatase [Magnetococcales bacterium]